MKTRVQKTSLEAFETVDLCKSQQIVFEVIKSVGCITAKGIAFHLGLPINSITPRVNELLHLQVIKISKVAKDKSKAHSNVNYYSIRNRKDALNVFEKSWESKFLELYGWMELNYPGKLHEFDAIVNHQL